MTRKERQARAQRLYRRKPQPSLREIAEELGVSVGTVHRDLNPDMARRYRIASRDYRRRQGKETEVLEK